MKKGINLKKLRTYDSVYDHNMIILNTNYVLRAKTIEIYIKV